MEGFYIHEAECVAGCPEGFKTNDDETACVELPIDELVADVIDEIDSDVAGGTVDNDSDSDSDSD